MQQQRTPRTGGRTQQGTQGRAKPRSAVAPASPTRRTISSRTAARGGYRGATAPVRFGTALGRRYSARGMLTAELLAGVAIVAVRAVEGYEPQADGTLKGKIAHPAGQYGPLPILAGLLAWFFLLSFLAARGGTKAKVAVIAGGLTDLVLAMKSMAHFTKVAATFSNFGTAQVPAGNWQTSGTIAGQADTGTGSSSPAGADAIAGAAGAGLGAISGVVPSTFPIYT